MGLINDLLKKLFGNRQKEAEVKTVPYNDYMERWERERQERIVAAELRLKDWVVESVKEKGSLPFSWESGNDEAFVTFEHMTDAEEENFQDLEGYIIDKLDIPDAGEFQMNGSGTIYLENNFIKVKYSSIMKALVDFNEETEEEVYSDEEQDAGDKVLFAI